MGLHPLILPSQPTHLQFLPPPSSEYLLLTYSETLNNEYIERIHQMSYSSLSDNEMLQIFIFYLNDYMELFKLFPHIHGYLFLIRKY